MRHAVATVIILNLSLTSAIYNATYAQPHQFPYSVLVKRLNKFCTGAIISDIHVITAAHCVYASSDSVFVTVGAHRFSDDGEEIESRRFWVHENFTMPSAVHDVAIVELRKRLTFGHAVQAIEISSEPEIEAVAEEISVAGWGFRSEWDRADVLMHTNMQLIPLDECLQFRSFYIEALNENHICTVAVEGMPCSGDSGAPFVSTRTNKLVGIYSYLKDAEDGVAIGYNDCRANVPAVAVRIAPYLGWISEKTGIVFADDDNET